MPHNFRFDLRYMGVLKVKRFWSYEGRKLAIWPWLSCQFTSWTSHGSPYGRDIQSTLKKLYYCNWLNLRPLGHLLTFVDIFNIGHFDCSIGSYSVPCDHTTTPGRQRLGQTVGLLNWTNPSELTNDLLPQTQGLHSGKGLLPTGLLSYSFVLIQSLLICTWILKFLVWKVKFSELVFFL